MRLQRTKNTIEGAIWGSIEKFISILLPFFVRTILIKKLGMEYLGLSGLFTSVLSVLNLTELGFGTAIVFSLYKPIAEDNYELVGAIVNYLKKVYRVIGTVALTGGIALIPFLPKFIKSDVPEDINLVLIYMIFLVNTSVSYFLYAYKSSLLSALQCTALMSRIELFANMFMRLSQILVLLFVQNYYAYAVLMPITTIITNIVRGRIVDKKYSIYLEYSRLDKGIREDIKRRLVPLMSTKLATVLVNSADTLVISAALGLKDVALYNNYYYVITCLMGFLVVVYNSMQAGIGNSLVVDSHQKIMADFDKFCFINNWLITVCAAILLNLYQPFITIWLGEKGLLPTLMVILFVTYFYANTIQRIVVIYKDAAGIWRQDMVRCYLSVGLNLAVNILTVNRIGLYGVIGSSVLANLIGLPWMGYILYKNVFKEKSGKFYAKELVNAIIAIVICFITYNLCNQIGTVVTNNYFRMVIYAAVSFCTANVVLLLIYSRSKQFKEMIAWTKKNILKRG